MPGYAPGYGYPPAPYPYYAPPVPPPAPPKRRTGLIVGIVVAVVVVLVLACGGGAFALIALRQPTAAHLNATQPTISAQSTTAANAPIIYSNTFASDAVGWSNDQYCKLGAGGYHITGRACFAPIGNQTNVDISVQVKQLSGPPIYGYGVSLRNTAMDQRYDVDIDSNGKWVAFLCTGTNPTSTANCKEPVGFTANPAIHGGLNVTNTIEVKAQGPQFQFYVNGVLVGSFTDSTYPAGTLGLVSESSDVEVVFSQLVVKALS